MSKIELVKGDITQQKVDVIVNAANNTLLGGGGVDGAIHRAAGPALLQECRKLGGCPTGGAKITRAYRLPARYVVHTVGPVWQGGSHGEDELLRDCYRNSLKLAEQNGAITVAFPSISTGAYRFPIERASRIAVDAVREFLSKTRIFKKVLFVCYSQSDFDVYLNQLGAVSQEISYGTLF
jgi:O-acetyl-ADP-ribose deacetylase (regulator of RNase III)